jgi:hypothetical protein
MVYNTQNHLGVWIFDELKRYQSNLGIRTSYEEMMSMQIDGNAVVPLDIP